MAKVSKASAASGNIRFSNPYMYSTDSSKMALGDYLHALGDETGFIMSRQAGISPDIVKNVSKGHPIALSAAQKIAGYLSQQYQRHIQVGDIAEMYTLNPGHDLPPVSPDDASENMP